MFRTRLDYSRLWGLFKLLTLRGLYLSGILCIIGSVLLITTLNRPSESRARIICKHNLKQIVIAVHRYHDDFHCFPPPFTTSERGVRLHSWRTLILPYLDQQALYDRIRLSEPWNSPHNLDVAEKFTSTAQSVYRCQRNPIEEDGSGSDTNYLAIVGPLAAWQVDRPLSIDDFIDGTVNTLFIVEVANSGIHWMEPRDLYVGQMSMTVNAVYGQGISSYHSEEESPYARIVDSFIDSRPVREGVATVSTADGSVFQLPASLPDDLLEQLITIDDGLPIEGWKRHLD